MAAPYFTYFIYTLFCCIKKIVESCGYVKPSGLVVQNNSSNSLVLILHRQFGNVDAFRKSDTIFDELPTSLLDSVMRHNSIFLIYSHATLPCFIWIT